MNNKDNFCFLTAKNAEQFFFYDYAKGIVRDIEENLTNPISNTKYNCCTPLLFIGDCNDAQIQRYDICGFCAKNLEDLEYEFEVNDLILKYELQAQ
ncbi:MAG: hypothetical protein LC122_13815 [Chitinophagales bacterium]|nr:hypothetical protein [Chitinophagales bacterium]